MGKSRQKRSITIARHRTSISLEDAFWDALAKLAEVDGEIDRRSRPRDRLAARRV